MPDLQIDHPCIHQVLAVLASVGLPYPKIRGSGIILEGDVDFRQACTVPSFFEQITDNHGRVGEDTIQRGMLEGRRALLGHAVNDLVNNHGAKLVKIISSHGPLVDEIYIIKMGDTTLHLTLMPYVTKKE